MSKPKSITSPKVCPHCGDRGTKIINLSAKTEPYKCQRCQRYYDFIPHRNGIPLKK